MKHMAILLMAASKYVVFWIFLLLLFLGLPVMFAMMGASGLQLWQMDKLPLLSMQMNRIFSGIASFPLMAVPLFILAGEIMNTGVITRSLIAFSRSMLGHLRGGLAYVNILSSMLFAGLSGSAVADTSALGSILIPAMERNGYSRKFAAAITAASSVIGPIIPPSGLMILYAYVMKVDVAKMFLGGIVPGVLIGISLMVMTHYMAKKRDFPVSDAPASWSDRGHSFRRAFFPLLTPIILLGGILSGYFTPTEAAVVAVGYALLLNIITTLLQRLGLVSEGGMSVSSFMGVLKRTVVQTGVILLLVGVASGYSQIIVLSRIPETITSVLLGVTENKYVFLFIINILLLIVGMVLDAGPAILILGPILSRAAAAYEIDPVHFAVLMCVNVTVGLATPPMGLVLFVAASVAKEKFISIVKEIIPFLIVEITVIFAITYIPILTLGLPTIYDWFKG